MLAAAALVLLVPRSLRQRLLPALLAYAVGGLLGAALLGLLPHALDQADADVVFWTLLAGLVGSFALERLVLWRHCHDGECGLHGAGGPLVLLGDGLHNLVDGVVIAGAFVTAVPLGVATTIAVMAHELPQELGDFAILLDAGYPPARALALNTLSSAATPIGGLLGWLALEAMRPLTPYLLALAAASFLYVAVADLIPGLHRRAAAGQGLVQLALVLAGVATIALLG